MPMDIDDDLEKLAPDLIPFSVEELHRERLAQAGAPPPANQNLKKVGRNDPCPCGSGKKFKKCCLMFNVVCHDYQAPYIVLLWSRPATNQPVALSFS